MWSKSLNETFFIYLFIYLILQLTTITIVTKKCVAKALIKTESRNNKTKQTKPKEDATRQINKRFK